MAERVIDRMKPTGRAALQRGAEFGRAAAERGLPIARRITSAIRPLGWFVMIVAFVGWIVGVTYGWLELLTIATCAALLTLVCAGFLLGRTGLDVRIDLRPHRTTVGLPANGEISVRNTTERRLLPSRVDLEIGQAVASFSMPSLAGGESHDELFRIGTDHRGIIQVGPARIVKADPVGLFGRVVSQSDPMLLYVHPKTVKVGGAGAGFLRDLEGRESADLSPSDLAFHSLREYVPGDDRRHVHWRTSARVGRLMVQQFIDTRRSQVLLALNEDIGAYESEDGFEIAVSALGSIGQQVIREGQTRTVVSGSRILGSVSPGTLLDELSGVECRAEGAHLVDTLSLGSRQCPDASLVVVVTGRHTTLSEVRASALRFSLANRVVVVRIDPAGSGFQRVDQVLLFSIAALEELPAVMNVAVTT
jgi:uncharacterized protein (DUF58 family)